MTYPNSAITLIRVTARASLLRHADFRRLWIGDTASQLGYALGVLAVPYLAVTELNATEFGMGVLTALGSVGFLVVGLPAGAIVDRHRKRSLMMMADVGRAILLLTIPIAWWLDLLTLPHLMVVATGVGMLSVFFDVSYQSYLPLLVDPDHVVEGNAKLQASQSVSQAAGPALAGFLLHRVGAAWVLAGNAAGYLFSAGSLRRIRHREQPPHPATHRSLRLEIIEGLRFIFNHRLLRRLIACTAIANLTSSIGAALVIPYMVRELHFSALTIGFVDSAAACGGIAGALAATAVARRLGEGPTIIVTAALASVLTFCNPLASVLPAVPTMIIGGIGLMAGIVIYNIATVSFRQRLCPPALLGRMNASARFIVWGTMPVGAFLGGILGRGIGIVPTLWLAAALGLAALLPVSTPSLWKLRRLPGHDEPSDGTEPVQDAASVQNPPYEDGAVNT